MHKKIEKCSYCVKSQYLGQSDQNDWYIPKKKKLRFNLFLKFPQSPDFGQNFGILK